MKRIVLLTVSCCAFGTAYSGGYRVSVQGQKAMGMGHTGVALGESAETVFFNPAGMTLLEDNATFTAGATLISSEIEYYSADTNTGATTDSPLGTPISLYYSRKHSDQLSYGLGIYTPFGSTVEWPDDWAGSHLINNISLAAIFFQPTAAWQFNDRFSAGIGLIYASGGVEFDRNLNTSLSNENGDRSKVTLDASGVDDFGANLGFMAKVNDKIQIGVNYRTEMTLEAEGQSADFENIPASLTALFTDTTFSADVPLPAELTLGLSYKHNAKTTVAVDLNFTDWSVYEELLVDFDNAVPDSVNARGYKDTTTFRVGVQHQYNDLWTVRGGFYFDETPIVSGLYNPDSPRDDATFLTIGATYNHSPSLAFDVSAFTALSSEVTNSYDQYAESDGTFSPFGGTYLSSATGIGFGVSYNY